LLDEPSAYSLKNSEQSWAWARVESTRMLHRMERDFLMVNCMMGLVG